MGIFKQARIARLPEHMDEPTLAGLLPGESCWTVPWAMWVDGDRCCWLHPGYLRHAHSGGTVQMRVQRIGDEYHVWPPADQRYSLQGHHGYISPDDTPWIPVAEIH
jgi:hypothetical protein